MRARNVRIYANERNSHARIRIKSHAIEQMGAMREAVSNPLRSVTLEHAQK
jgi:hypothetical protein